MDRKKASRQPVTFEDTDLFKSANKKRNGIGRVIRTLLSYKDGKDCKFSPLKATYNLQNRLLTIEFKCKVSKEVRTQKEGFNINVITTVDYEASLSV